MKNIIWIIIALIGSSGCSANWHLRQAEKHEGIAIAKGAKIEDKVRIEVDTIVKDTVIFIEGSTLDDSFGFNDNDTVFLENKEGVKAKLTIDSKKKKGNAQIDCPPKEVKVPQKFYVRKTITITRTLSSGYTLWQLIGVGILGAFLMLIILMLVSWFKSYKSRPAN